MLEIPFEVSTPSKILYVSTTGSATGSGSQTDPLLTIQAAVNLATPGTTIMVAAGTYAENVKINASGTPDAPISLVSADGPGAAKIVPGAASASATLSAFGEENIVISGFDVSGGNVNTNGIQFGMSGSNFTDMTKNIVIKDNIVHDTVKDSIKVSQGDSVYVIDNTVSHAGDQGVDFVDVNNSVIARNDISYITGPAALFAKGGSTNVLIAENKVTHASVDGIEVGGYSDMTWARPADRGWEAKNITVIDNIVQDVGKRPLNIIGAQDCQITHNFLHSNPTYYYIVSISADNNTPALNSANIVFTENVFDRSDHWLQVLTGQGTGLQNINNHFDGVWTGVAGPHSGPLDYNVSYLPQEATYTWPVTATVHGTTGDDRLSCGATNDIICGSGGSDTFLGGTGNDTYLIDGNDLIVENASAGRDLVMSYQSHTLEANVENLTLLGHANLMGTGNVLQNCLVGNDGNNYLDGCGANDGITGGVGNDTIIGGTGNDTMNGGDGDDRIDGSVGYDKMTGGAGADTFVVGSLKAHDVISDFKVGTDHIEIQATAAQTADLHITSTTSGAMLSYNCGACQIVLTGVDATGLDPHQLIAAAA
jgi:Ca2+-binding RTX toxin-like protein